MKKKIKCPICFSKNCDLIWNNMLRSGKNIWTKKKRKASRCKNCEVIFLNKRSKNLIDNKIFRKKFDGDNSIDKYLVFNKPREKFKLNKIKQYIKFKNKSVLESNCGAASNLDLIKNEAKITAGLDSIIYKKHVEKKHLFFSTINELKKNKLKYDIILSLAELEHQNNIFNFLSNLKSKLKKNGLIVFRIPNYNNIYRYILGQKYLMYDFRLSHNFYFSEKSCDYLFKKAKFSIFKKVGLQEYSINHLIQYIKTSKRVNKYKNIINKKISKQVSSNLEKSFASTSFLYFLKI